MSTFGEYARLASAILLASLIALFLSCCSIGGAHTPDTVLEKRFADHRDAFNALLQDLQADAKLTAIGPRHLSYDGRLIDLNVSEMEDLGFSRERWKHFMKLLNEVGAADVGKSQRSIVFEVDHASVWNGVSQKGYLYGIGPEDHLKSSLDRYRPTDADRNGSGDWSVCKRLDGNWYLYLIIRGRR